MSVLQVVRTLCKSQKEYTVVFNMHMKVLYYTLCYYKIIVISV